VATILIVDPDPATRSLLELLIARLGHRPVGPREWVGGVRPDLLLLEPASAPGLRLARGVRRRFPELPILCVSIDGPTAESRALGAVEHLMKPFRRAELDSALGRLLGSYGSHTTDDAEFIGADPIIETADIPSGTQGGERQ
jgi:CheY-like chemotaxis protein